MTSHIRLTANPMVRGLRGEVMGRSKFIATLEVTEGDDLEPIHETEHAVADCTCERYEGCS
jgi:hypothetical protein